MIFGEKLEKQYINVAENINIAVCIKGTGPPLLLLHGYPQTGYMWHKIAPRLANNYTVIVADLRGYGDSDKPASSDDHAVYSKRAMAADMMAVMTALGHSQFFVAGHDRGGRVAHRLARDYPQVVTKLAVLDIAPTAMMYDTTDMHFATSYYHWFFLIQPAPFPETLIGHDPKYFLESKMRHWGKDRSAITDDAFDDYLRCFPRQRQFMLLARITVHLPALIWSMMPLMPHKSLRCRCLFCGVRPPWLAINMICWPHGERSRRMYLAFLCRAGIICQKNPPTRPIRLC